MELLIFCIVIGWILGSNYAYFKMQRVLRKIVNEDLDVDLKSYSNKHEVPILVTERHENMLYLWNKETNDFMCQGIDLKELQEKLSKHKNIHMACVQHDDKYFWFINGEIKDSIS